MAWNRTSWVGQEYSGNRWYEYQHLTMLEFVDLTGIEFRKFNSFAVIRNPYARLESDFRWRRQIIQQRPNAPLRPFDTFKEFVQAIPKDIDRNWFSYMESADQADANFLIHVRPQHHYVCSSSGEQMVEKILAFERLKSDFDQLSGEVGLVNKTVTTPRQRNYMESFDKGTMDSVNAIYARDFELGSYPRL